MRKVHLGVDVTYCVAINCGMLFISELMFREYPAPGYWTKETERRWYNLKLFIWKRMFNE